MKISIQFSPLVTMTLAETRSTDNWRKTAAFQMQKQISVLPPTKIYFFENFFFRQRLINLKIIKDEIDFFSNMELLRAAAVKKCLKKITFFIYFKHFSKKHLIFCCHRVGHFLFAQLSNRGMQTLYHSLLAFVPFRLRLKKVYMTPLVRKETIDSHLNE